MESLLKTSRQTDDEDHGLQIESCAIITIPNVFKILYTSAVKYRYMLNLLYIMMKKYKKLIGNVFPIVWGCLHDLALSDPEERRNVNALE